MNTPQADAQNPASRPHQTPNVVVRSARPEDTARLIGEGAHPLLARVYAARGVSSLKEVDNALEHLLPPADMSNLDQAAQALFQAIELKQKLLVVADFDADGATACAVAIRGLRRFGAEVDFLVPDRFRFGYGLTPALIDAALTDPDHTKPDWIITVDNGISSIDGVKHAQSLGMNVLITDHHLPGKELPQTLIVNPNVKGCPFPSKNLAGVGVMFYLLMALRAYCRDQALWPAEKIPRLDDLLPIVALGTVADVVRLDANNRRLVAQGLARIRRGTSFAGLNALFAVSGQNVHEASVTSLGFFIGPRINAAGRLADMSVGIRCLLEDDPIKASEYAQALDSLNRERQKIELESRDAAIEKVLESLSGSPFISESSLGLVLHDENWHQGVVGLIAGKLKEKFHRPTIIFATDQQSGDRLKGSGRSIPAVHLRDVLERIDTHHPGLIIAFGGHAMAAGLTLYAKHLDQFTDLFNQTIAEFAKPADLNRTLEVDGPLEAEFHRIDVANLIESSIWGQGFPSPVFINEFEVLSQRRLKEKHLKLNLKLRSSNEALPHMQAIWFNAPHDLSSRATLAYRLATNNWQGVTELQLEVVGAIA